jgi:hypothetical protein
VAIARAVRSCNIIYMTTRCCRTLEHAKTCAGPAHKFLNNAIVRCGCEAEGKADALVSTLCCRVCLLHPSHACVMWPRPTAIQIRAGAELVLHAAGLPTSSSGPSFTAPVRSISVQPLHLCPRRAHRRSIFVFPDSAKHSSRYTTGSPALLCMRMIALHMQQVVRAHA